MNNVNHYMMRNMIHHFDNDKSKIPDTYIEIPEGVDFREWLGSGKTLTTQNMELYFIETEDCQYDKFLESLELFAAHHQGEEGLTKEYAEQSIEILGEE